MADVAEETTEEVAAETPQVEESAPQEITVETSEAEATEEPTEESTAQPRPKGDRTQKRINELTRKQKDAERETQYWRDQALEQQKGQQVPAVDTAITEPPMPPDKFDYDDDATFFAAKETYQTEHARYIQHEVGKLAEKQVQEANQREAQKSQRQAVATLEKKLDDGYDKYEDFDEVINNQAVPWTPDMASALIYTENASDVAYQISKDPELAEKISAMYPAQQAIEIAKLDAKIGATTKSTTNAPAPIKTVKQNGGPSKPLDPVKDWSAWAQERNKQEHGR